MARMIPGNGPRGGDGARPSCARLYERLGRELPDDWLVIHKPRWVGRSVPGEPLPDGRADFALAHPDRGILLLDVLDGGVTWDPHSGRWHAQAGQQGRDIADPFIDLEGRLDALVRHMRAHPSSVPSQPMTGFGVALPDVITPRSGLAAHAPAALIVDMVALEDPTAAVEALFEHWSPRRPSRGSASARWWWRVFEDIFVAPRRLRLTLGRRVAADRREILSLGDRQVQVLDLLARVRRQTIYGPAGTGKTVLAVGKARLLADQGMRVLLTCYNKALGRYLQDAVADQPAITARHFHELCYLLADLEAKGVKPPASRRGQRHFFDEELPALLAEASDGLSERYDAIVVDEGQDFRASWWRALDTLGTDPERMIRYIFYDDAQYLGDGVAQVPGSEVALELRTNWRNTRSIVRHLATAEPRMEDLPCVAPEGAPVRFEPATPDFERALRRILMHLVGREEVQPEDIIILSGRQPLRSQASRIEGSIAGCRLTTEDETGAIRIRSVQSFKGLEAPVVILTELDDYPAQRARQLHYVGASRAMTLLVVMGDASLGGERNNRRRDSRR